MEPNQNANPKLAQYNDNVANQLRQEGAEKQMNEDARNNEIRNSIMNTSKLAYKKGVQDTLGPQPGQDLNQYLVDGFKNGTLAPQEAMQAIQSPEVDPRVRRMLEESLMNTGSQNRQVSGLGNIQQYN